MTREEYREYKEQKDAMYIEMYLDWWNNYLTIGCFALDYGYSLEFATFAVREGKNLYEKKLNEQKKMEQIKTYIITVREL